jgi:hypothetical protein
MEEHRQNLKGHLEKSVLTQHTFEEGHQVFRVKLRFYTLKERVHTENIRAAYMIFITSPIDQ